MICPTAGRIALRGNRAGLAELLKGPAPGFAAATPEPAPRASGSIKQEEGLTEFTLSRPIHIAGKQWDVSTGSRSTATALVAYTAGNQHHNTGASS